MLSVSILVLSATLLLAMVLNLVLKPAWSARLTTSCMLAAAAGGLLFYGLGFAETTGDLLISVLRTPIAVTRMFVGANELAAISASRLVSPTFGLMMFWLFHLMAFYSMASAAMLTLGAEALRHLRLLLSYRGDLTLIYGINENSIALGEECRAAGNTVVFVADSVSSAEVSELNNKGMSVLSGSAAVESQPAALRRLHLSKRKVTVYALDENTDRDLFYALRLRDTLKEAGVPAERSRVTLPGAEDIITPMLQVSRTQYGFGFVNVFDPAELTARAMIRLCPPWEQLRFGPDGRAQEDFSCAVIGFGRHGQAALRALAENGQFAGSRFHAAVFSPNFDNESGALEAGSPELCRRYDIEHFAADGRSRTFYSFLETHLSTLKIIAVCTGDEARDREISDDLMLYFQRCGTENICVIQCGDKGARYQERVGSAIQVQRIYSRAFLSAEEADRGAIQINAVYDSSEHSDWEKWVACDSFSKMSSRATAEFAPAFLFMSHSSLEELQTGTWKPEGELLQNLGETEHLRWSAFHYAMGYAPMTKEEHEERLAAIRQARERGETCALHPAKDAQKRLHACLVPWNELDELSERERRLLGNERDYKKIDINNVLALPRFLAVETKSGGAL